MHHPKTKLHRVALAVGIERGHLSATPMAGKFVRNEIPPPATVSVEFSTGWKTRTNTVYSTVLVRLPEGPEIKRPRSIRSEPLPAGH
jgi:hypothetical protein